MTWGSQMLTGMSEEKLRLMRAIFMDDHSAATPQSTPVKPRNWNIIEAEQRRNRKPELICANCLTANFVHRANCRQCSHDKGWRLETQGELPGGQPRPFSALKAPSAKGKGKGKPPVPVAKPTEAKPATATQPKEPAVTPSTAEMSEIPISQLKEKQAKLEDAMARLSEAGIAIPTSLETELAETKQNLILRRSDGKRLDWAGQKLKKAGALKKQLQDSLTELREKIKSTEKELQDACAAEAAAQTAYDKLKMDMLSPTPSEEETELINKAAASVTGTLSAALKNAAENGITVPEADVAKVIAEQFTQLTALLHHKQDEKEQAPPPAKYPRTTKGAGKGKGSEAGVAATQIDGQSQDAEMQQGDASQSVLNLQERRRGRSPEPPAQEAVQPETAT